MAGYSQFVDFYFEQGFLKRNPCKKWGTREVYFFQVFPPNPSVDVSSPPHMQFIRPIYSFWCYDFKRNLKVRHLLIFLCVYRMWRGTAGIPEWIWHQKHSDSETKGWFGHNVEPACTRIAAEVCTVSSSFVWDDAGGKLKWNSVLVVTVAVPHWCEGNIDMREAGPVWITDLRK